MFANLWSEKVSKTTRLVYAISFHIMLNINSAKLCLINFTWRHRFTELKMQLFSYSFSPLIVKSITDTKDQAPTVSNLF